MHREKLLIIVGPTASGKSALAVELARTFSGEVISADSRQVYRGLDIGTGKITKKEMRGVPHHLLDVASPKRNFSAADFNARARKTVVSIMRRGKLPILALGTGYYIDSFVGRITVPEVAPNLAFRNTLGKKSAAQLFALLTKRDPARARAMATPSERGNARRLIRALEIAAALGKVPAAKVKGAYDALWIGINPPLFQLEKKIRVRLHSRIRQGMIREAQRLRKSGLSFKRMEALGLEYRSLARLLQKKISKDEMAEELYRDIRRYAKKQLAYWKRNPNIRWFKPTDVKTVKEAVKNWLQISGR